MKIFNLIGKIILSIIVLLFLVYLGFQSNEYIVGNRYVTYLKENKLFSAPIADTIPLNFDETFYDNQLFFVGEVHELGVSPVIDVSTFKYLNQNNGVRTYVAELDIPQAYYLNLYLKDSTDISLKEILNNWVVNIGHISSEYREQKWGRFKTYYKQLDKEKKFEVYGVDKFRDFDLLRKLLMEKLPAYVTEIPEEKEEMVQWISVNIPVILRKQLFNTKDSLLFTNIIYNCSNPDNINSRDEFMYQNLKRYYYQKDWSKTKLYGCFGLYHTLQGVDETFAGRIHKNNFLEGKVVSLVGLYTNSHLTVPSVMLPEFMADSGTYTRLSYGFDNIFLSYIKGVEDYKRVSQNNSINLLKLDNKNSPYLNSTRGLYNFNIFNFLGGIPIDKNKSTTDYIQYVFFVDGSDWVKPD